MESWKKWFYFHYKHVFGKKFVHWPLYYVTKSDSDSEGWESCLLGCRTGSVIKSKGKQGDKDCNRGNTSLSSSLSPFSIDLITCVTLLTQNNGSLVYLRVNNFFIVELSHTCRNSPLTWMQQMYVTYVLAGTDTDMGTWTGSVFLHPTEHRCSRADSHTHLKEKGC